ncbi:MAG: DUF4350 domain-containing protein, partial [Actinobacteria bacterium]|nr:DUF4350 domain-containing protein [Actinomycetota bacterium]
MSTIAPETRTGADQGSGSDAAAARAGSATLVHAPGRMRRVLGWILVVALLFGVAVVGLLLGRVSPGQRGTLDPEVPGPGGTRALAQILRQQGVTVDVVRSRVEAESRLDEHTTLVMSDPYTLSDDAVNTLIDAAHGVVVLSPSARLLRILDLGGYASSPAGSAAPGNCDVPAFAHVGAVGPGQRYRADPGVTACFGDAESA